MVTTVTKVTKEQLKTVHDEWRRLLAVAAQAQAAATAAGHIYADTLEEWLKQDDAAFDALTCDDDDRRRLRDLDATQEAVRTRWVEVS